MLHSFVVLMEKRAWRQIAGRLALALGMAALAGSLGAKPVPQQKLAPDLKGVVAGKSGGKSNWQKDIGSRSYVKALVVSNSSDPELTELRARIVAVGGSVYYRYLTVPALSVMLPVDRVNEIAQRDDVDSVSPNRIARKTASLLEATTGTSSARTELGSTTLDGSGVGIAILDSGIGWNHAGFRASDPRQNRVIRAVDMQRVGDAKSLGVKDWTPGIDVSQSVRGNDRALVDFLKKLATDGDKEPDPYGHGTHVASVAAGRSASDTRNTTGIAPAANLIDVKVLDDNGTGQISDVLAGIDWVVMNAKALNIRVINLSLAADSTESYLTDPLCRAVRAAAAAGITVVVAAGNFGHDAYGRERYGSIGAPGNDPSVITVGSSHMRGTPPKSGGYPPTGAPPPPAATTASTCSARAARPAAPGLMPRACAVSTTCSSPIWWPRATRSSGPCRR
jgi:subtilisin family serine protease